MKSVTCSSAHLIRHSVHFHSSIYTLRSTHAFTHARTHAAPLIRLCFLKGHDSYFCAGEKRVPSGAGNKPLAAAAAASVTLSFSPCPPFWLETGPEACQKQWAPVLCQHLLPPTDSLGGHRASAGAPEKNAALFRSLLSAFTDGGLAALTRTGLKLHFCFLADEASTALRVSMCE